MSRIVTHFSLKIPPRHRPVSSSTPAVDCHSPLQGPYYIHNVRGTRPLLVACQRKLCCRGELVLPEPRRSGLRIGRVGQLCAMPLMLSSKTLLSLLKSKTLVIFQGLNAAVRFPVAANHGVVADGDASQDADNGKDGDVVS